MADLSSERLRGERPRGERPLMKPGARSLWSILEIGLLGCGEGPTSSTTMSSTTSTLPAPLPMISEAPCPTGMVLVSPPLGPFTLGMVGQPYGIVETAQLAVVEAPERGCAAAVARTPGALTCWVQTNQVDPVLAPHPVELAPFCIDAFPFPGQGTEYSLDGMTAWDARKLQELLATTRYGSRRLCTFSELEAAVAGPVANHRFLYGDEPDPTRCPDTSQIGIDPRCKNEETAVHDYGTVMSHWVVADPALVQHACAAPPCKAAGNHLLQPGALIVAGGTARAQTRQAPLTPHTWHDHGEPNPDGCDQMGWDDQPVICADPDARYMLAAMPAPLVDGETAWTALALVAARSRRVTEMLEVGLDAEVCDEALPDQK